MRQKTQDSWRYDRIVGALRSRQYPPFRLRPYRGQRPAPLRYSANSEARPEDQAAPPRHEILPCLCQCRTIRGSAAGHAARGCLHVIGISARHHVVGLFGVQRLAHAALSWPNGHNAADFYCNVLHAVLTAALADRLIVETAGEIPEHAIPRMPGCAAG